MSSWKVEVDRKKNCMTLFGVLQSLFSRSLPEKAIVKASEDIEYKLMVENELKSHFDADFKRVVDGLAKLKTFKDKHLAKKKLRSILSSIGKHGEKRKVSTSLRSSAAGGKRRKTEESRSDNKKNRSDDSLSLRLELNDDEMKSIEEEATAPIMASEAKGTSRGTSKDGRRTFAYKPVSNEEKLEKIKQLAKNNRYIKYYQELSTKYYPKLVGILNDISKKSRSEETRQKVKSHFSSLVNYLRGDGEPVTPQTVYNAKERLKRLFYWYQENLIGRMSDKRETRAKSDAAEKDKALETAPKVKSAKDEPASKQTALVQGIKAAMNDLTGLKAEAKGEGIKIASPNPRDESDRNATIEEVPPAQDEGKVKTSDDDKGGQEMGVKS